MKYNRGFTIVEILSVMVVMSILLSIAWAISDNYQMSARDDERRIDTTDIARSFERYYRNNSSILGSPSYPSTTQINPANIDGIIDVDNEQLYAPEESSISLVTATNTLCGSGDTCVRFTLYYQLEIGDTVETVESVHQQ